MTFPQLLLQPLFFINKTSTLFKMLSFSFSFFFFFLHEKRFSLVSFSPHLWKHLNTWAAFIKNNSPPPPKITSPSHCRGLDGLHSQLLAPTDRQTGKHLQRYYLRRCLPPTPVWRSFLLNSPF